MSRILVTGGAGFIGANFIHYELMHNASDSIICLDALTYAGNLASLKEALASGRVIFIHGDIRNRSCIDGVFEKYRPDIVVNFAAESHVDRSIDAPDDFITTNIIGTQRLLDACRMYGVGRFHQVSTDEVYGDLPIDRPDLRFTEDSPINPSSPYSASKAAADMLVQAYVRTFLMNATITRCSNNYGAFQFPEKLIPRMISLAMNDKPLPVYGNGENVRDWLHVYDHCAAIDLVMRNGEPGGIYNVGANNERSNIEIVRMLLERLGKSRELITFVTDRPGHDKRYAIDSTKLQTELGWQPRVSFDDGMRDTIKWYFKNAAWWQNILSGNYMSDNQQTLRQISGVK